MSLKNLALMKKLKLMTDKLKDILKMKLPQLAKFGTYQNPTRTCKSKFRAKVQLE